MALANPPHMCTHRRAQIRVHTQTHRHRHTHTPVKFITVVCQQEQQLLVILALHGEAHGRREATQDGGDLRKGGQVGRG